MFICTCTGEIRKQVIERISARAAVPSTSTMHRKVQAPKINTPAALGLVPTAVAAVVGVGIHVVIAVVVMIVATLDMLLGGLSLVAQEF